MQKRQIRLPAIYYAFMREEGFFICVFAYMHVQFIGTFFVCVIIIIIVMCCVKTIRKSQDLSYTQHAHISKHSQIHDPKRLHRLHNEIHLYTPMHTHTNPPSTHTSCSNASPHAFCLFSSPKEEQRETTRWDMRLL